jgi:rubrerythrin
MDIIEFALKMELDGKTFYEKQAAAETDPELKQILETLAEEEERHYRFFQTFKDNPNQLPPADTLGSPGAVDRVRNIFEEMSQQTEPRKFSDKAASVWKEALGIEERAVDFYKTRAAEETDAGRKRLLERLAEEETKHVYMIDSVLMYLKDPATFAESAQFRNFQSLEGR